ncbi:hypothetical protein [Nocardiopsis synnemataformans]|uniref:hypothetical protein n=1 Tax=Nocardiopsis synnemataformans TaxID=61305 RepID=UPI003EBA38DB
MVTPERTPPPAVTLLEYAAARRVDPQELADWASEHPLPDAVGERSGQPTYALVDLDVAWAGTVTIADFAAEYDLDTRQIAMSWPKWHPDLFPRAVGEIKIGHGRAKLYPRPPLEQIQQMIAQGWTVPEYAEHVGVSANTVRKTWWIKHKELRPPMVGTRDGTSVYSERGLDRLRRAAQGLPLEPTGSPEDLLTWEQLLTYFAEAAERGVPGTSREAMEFRLAQGLWPPGEEGADGIARWRRGEAERLQAELTARRGRRPSA